MTFSIFDKLYKKFVIYSVKLGTVLSYIFEKSSRQSAKFYFFHSLSKVTLICFCFFASKVSLFWSQLFENYKSCLFFVHTERKMVCHQIKNIDNDWTYQSNNQNWSLLSRGQWSMINFWLACLLIRRHDCWGLWCSNFMHSNDLFFYWLIVTVHINPRRNEGLKQNWN